MGVNPGYKQTKAGAFPADWEVKRLGDVATVTAGGTPSRTTPAYWNGDVPWITTAQVDFNTITQAEQFITVEGVKNSAAKALPPGTLLMALYGQGKTRAKVAILGIEATTNQACAAISINSGISRAFVFHYLASQYDAIRGLSNTGNQENLNGAIVRSIPIPVPSLREQSAITDALSEMDALISGLGQLISKKRNLKQAAMQKLLTGMHRLPGCQGEWNFRTLGELFMFKNGLNKGKEFFGEGTPIVNYMDVYQNSAVYSQGLEGRVTVSQQELRNFEVKKGDVFFTRTSETVAEVGVAAVMLDELQDTVFSGFILRARAMTHDLCDEFKRYCFASHAVRQQIVSKSTYTTRALTNGRVLSNVVLALPPRDEQKAIAAVLSDMDAEIEALERKRDKTRLVKQGMIQELLTGRRRLA